MELPPLTKILHPGALGGHEFANIVRKLLESEAQESRTFSVQNFSDARGDDRGADARLLMFDQEVVLQIKFYSSPLSSAHKSAIKADYETFRKKNPPEVDWWLITPEELFVSDLQWLRTFSKERVLHKGHNYLSNLFFKHPHIGQDVYRNHEFKRLAEERRIPKRPDEFFNRLTDPQTYITSLMREALPTYYDCRQVFNEEWAEVMAMYYQEQGATIENAEFRLPEWRQGCRVRYWEVNWAEYLESGHDHVPGGMKNLIGIIRPETVFYAVKLIEDIPDKESGYSLFGWAFINQRWVFFGKIHRGYQKVSKLRAGAAMRSILRIAKCFRLKRYFRDVPTSDFRLFIRMVANEILRDREAEKR